MAAAMLVERDRQLDSLADGLRAAAATGRVVLVAGEAGIGKSSLLRACADRHAAAGGAVWWGACDALETPLPLAPWLDIARDAAPRFAAQLDGPRPALFEAVLDELRLAAGPRLVVVEDAHWADDATLDLLKYLGRRIERCRALLAISYRDDEVGPAHPLRRVLGELPPALRSHLPVPRLSAAAVATLARRAGRAAEGLHALTHGNAFFVTELLREGAGAAAGGAVPRTVQDVVLGRYARLDAPAQALLRLVAVVPGRTERWLAEALLPTAPGGPADGAHDHAADRALASGLLLADAQGWSYRHELARVAVEAALSVPQALALHRQVLAALQAATPAVSPARLVHHALQAQDTAAISRWAPEAATQAARRGAHREARAHWQAALRHGQPADAAELRRWLEAFTAAGLATGRNDDDLRAFERLEQLALDAGDTGQAAWQRARRGQACIQQLRHRDAEHLVGEALAQVQGLPPSADTVRVRHTAAWLRMLERDCVASVREAEAARAQAVALGDDQAAAAIDTSIAVARLFIDLAPALADCERHLARLAAAGQPAARLNLMSTLGSGLGELVQLPRAEAWLREALAQCQALEIDGPVDYARAWLALCRLGRGGWDEAAALASEVVGRAGGAGRSREMSRLMALLALGRLRLRRGDPGATAALDEALALAAPSQTLQRLAPTHAARAEAAFAAGDLAAVRAEVAAALPLARAKGHPWFIGELAYWGWRAGLAGAVPKGCAAPYAHAIAGRWRDAAAAWQALDCPYEQARALAEGDEAARRAALAIFERLGARPAAEALRRALRAAGVRGVERGARAATRGHPAGLTRAEQAVLALLATGLRNAEIAARLHRSVRTVDHHVAAVLAKLGVETRQAAVAQAQRAGWLQPAGDGAI